jgi:thiol-disulfide isomerase/thioredoxin
MKYLKLHLLVALILLAGHVMYAQGKLVVQGDVFGREGQPVQLIKNYYDKPEILDTDTIRNRKFRLSGAVTEVMPVMVVFRNGKVNTPYNVILENGTVSLMIYENQRSVVSGGKYNKLLFGYQSTPAFIKVADSLQMFAAPGKREKIVSGSKEETEAVALFMRKAKIMSDYQEKIMKTSKDPLAQVMAAILLELQPDADAAIKVVDNAAITLGENSSVIKRARQIKKEQDNFIEMRKNRMTGQPYTDFTAATLAGDSVRLAPIVKEHKYTLLQFWGSWCIPCRKEIPLLKQLYKAYNSKGLEIVSFSIDHSRDSWQDASKKENFEWPNISDLKADKSPVYKQYPIMGIPANVIIDQDGKIVASNLVGESLSSKIAELFKQ